MATLTCDICNGTLLVSSGGIVVCSSCRTMHALPPNTKKPTANRPITQTKKQSTTTVPKAPGLQPHLVIKPFNTTTNIEEARELYTSEKYAEAITLTKNILVQKPDCGDAWFVGAMAVFKKNADSQTISKLKNVLQDVLNAFRDREFDYNAADEYFVFLEVSFTLALREIVSDTVTQYEVHKMSGNSFMSFITELEQLQDLYEDITIYLGNSNRLEVQENRTYIVDALCSHFYDLIWNHAPQVQKSKPSEFLLLMEECIATLYAIIKYCGDTGDPKSAYKNLRDIHECLTNDLFASSSAMKALGASIADLDDEYTNWELRQRSFDVSLFETQVVFWREHRKQWCTLQIELERLRSLLNAQSTSTNPEIQQTLKRRIGQLSAFTDIHDRRTFLARIKTITLQNPDWCVQFTQTSDAIADQDEIIDANKWFFGESRRRRIAAQQTKDELLASLKHI